LNDPGFRRSHRFPLVVPARIFLGGNATTAVAVTVSITLSRYLNQSDSQWWHGDADHHEVYRLRPYVTLPFSCYILSPTIQKNTPLAVENTECRDADQRRSGVCSAQFRLHDEEVRRPLNARKG